MTRSLKKSFFQKPFVLKALSQKATRNPIRIFSRSHTILANTVGRPLRVYNGLKFSLVLPTQAMFKAQAGEFAFTRAFFVPKKKRKKQLHKKRKK